MKILSFLLFYFLNFYANSNQYIQLTAFNINQKSQIEKNIKILPDNVVNKLYIDKKGDIYLLKLENPSIEDINILKQYYKDYFFTYLISSKSYKYNQKYGIMPYKNDIQKINYGIKKINETILMNNINDVFINKPLLKNYYLNCYKEINIQNQRVINIPNHCQIFMFPFLNSSNEFFNVGILQKNKINELNEILENESKIPNTKAPESKQDINHILENKIELPNIKTLNDNTKNEIFIPEVENNQNSFINFQNKENIDPKVIEKETTKIIQPIIIEKKNELDHDKIEWLDFLTKKTFLIGLFSGFILILSFFIYIERKNKNEKENNQNEISNNEENHKQIILSYKNNYKNDYDYCVKTIEEIDSKKININFDKIYNNLFLLIKIINNFQLNKKMKDYLFIFKYYIININKEIVLKIKNYLYILKFKLNHLVKYLKNNLKMNKKETKTIIENNISNNLKMNKKETKIIIENNISDNSNNNSKFKLESLKNDLNNLKNYSKIQEENLQILLNNKIKSDSEKTDNKYLNIKGN